MESELLSGKKVLIVEDDLASSVYLNRILEKSGMIILNAHDGQEAVDIVSGNADIDVVLMDIQLPVMDGYVTLKKIKEIRDDIVVIAQTAFGLMDEKEKIINSGFNDYLIKPIVSKALKDKLISNLNL